MAKYSCAIEIPKWLDTILASPILLCRWLWYGYIFRLIRLTRGKYAKVDLEDYAWLSREKWHANKRPHTWYAVNHIRVNGKRVYQQMHRLIMNAPLRHSSTELTTGCSGQAKLVVDHINHDGLDNRKANLRLATLQQNAWNSRHGRYGGKSRYRGVSWNKRAGKWRACIYIDGSQRHIGHWDSEEEAARAYDREALKQRGEFALLNFPLYRNRSKRKVLACQDGVVRGRNRAKNGKGRWGTGKKSTAGGRDKNR